MNKKLLLGLGALSLTILPLTAFVSCGDVSPSVEPDTGKPPVVPDTFIILENLKITKEGKVLGFDDLLIATKELVIKEKYGDIVITSIGSKAFENNQLTSLTIPNSVTSIGDSAFNSNQLTSLTIPNSVTSIGDSAFNSNQLTSLDIPNSVTSIGDSAFKLNQLTSLDIPNSVTSIGDSAFNSNQLTETSDIKLPTKFDNSSDCVRIGIPTLSWIVTENLKVARNGQILGFNDSSIYENELNIKTSYNGITVTSIGDSAFLGLYLVESLILPNSVTSIGNRAFENTRLSSLILPNSVISIGKDSFRSNTLSSITLGNSVKSIGESSFYQNELTSLTIPNSVTSIGEYAFTNNNIASLTIPNSVTSIGSWAFKNNRFLSSSTIILPSQFDTDGERARLGLPVKEK